MDGRSPQKACIIRFTNKLNAIMSSANCLPPQVIAKIKLFWDRRKTPSSSLG